MEKLENVQRFARCVEKRGKAWLLEIILRATTWTECRFPVMSVEENSGRETNLGGANVFLIDQSDKLKV